MTEKPRSEDGGSDSLPGSAPLLTLGRILGALALPVAASLVCDSIRPEAGEPLVLRWLRVVADHPVRAFLAAALVILALRPALEPPARS